MFVYFFAWKLLLSDSLWKRYRVNLLYGQMIFFFFCTIISITRLELIWCIHGWRQSYLSCPSVEVHVHKCSHNVYLHLPLNNQVHCMTHLRLRQLTNVYPDGKPEVKAKIKSLELKLRVLTRVNAWTKRKSCRCFCLQSESSKLPLQRL